VAISLGAGIFGGQLKDILVIVVKIQTAAKKGGGDRKMSGIESNIMPFVSTIGFGG
jgi:hypothetical protein